MIPIAFLYKYKCATCGSDLTDVSAPFQAREFDCEDCGEPIPFPYFQKPLYDETILDIVDALGDLAAMIERLVAQYGSDMLPADRVASEKLSANARTLITHSPGTQ